MVSGIGMTRRVVAFQHVVYSETQGKHVCVLEVVREASLEHRQEFSLYWKWAEWSISHVYRF